jgi:hypothetical protein
MHTKTKEEEADIILRRTTLSPYFWAGIAMLDFGNSSAANLLELACQSVSLIQLCHIIATSYAFADEQNVRHSSPAGHVCQESLKLRAKRVDV